MACPEASVVMPAPPKRVSPRPPASQLALSKYSMAYSVDGLPSNEPSSEMLPALGTADVRTGVLGRTLPVMPPVA